MGANNTIVIIGNKSALVSQLSSKLVLLRDLDKVVDTNSINAIPFLKQHLPNVILLHCEQNDRARVGLIREIKKEPLLRNAPILLVGDNLNRDFILDAFDAGISDLIQTPVLEHELLMRVIWCISRNNQNVNDESRAKFLASLGIIYEETGFYTQKHGEDFLINEVDYAIKHHLNSCLMLLAPDDRHKAGGIEFWKSLKKSIRLNDSVVVGHEGRFYIILPKTKLNGVYSLFERINSNLGEDNTISAAAAEILDKSFLEMKENMELVLKKALENGKSLIVASEDITQGMVQESVKLTKETVLRSGNWVETRDNDEEIFTEDELAQRLFGQTYKKKCKLVVEPVFKKFSALILEQHPNAQLQKAIEHAHSKLSLSQKGIISSFYITHLGGPKVKIEAQHIQNGEVKNSLGFTMEITELGFQKLSELLEDFLREFANLVDAVSYY